MSKTKVALALLLMLVGSVGFVGTAVGPSFELPGWMHLFGTTEPPMVMVRFKAGQKLGIKQTDIVDAGDVLDWTGDNCALLDDKRICFWRSDKASDWALIPDAKRLMDYQGDTQPPDVVIANGDKIDSFPLPDSPEAMVKQLEKYRGSK